MNDVFVGVHVEIAKMQTEYESICRNEIHQMTPKLEEGPHRCITQHPGFLPNFINEYVVELAVYEYNYIGLYRENAIAIESEAKDPFGGNVYYVTMQITFPIPEFARKERTLHCDVVHVTTKWVSRLVLDHAIASIQTSR